MKMSERNEVEEMTIKEQDSFLGLFYSFALILHLIGIFILLFGLIRNLIALIENQSLVILMFVILPSGLLYLVFSQFIKILRITSTEKLIFSQSGLRIEYIKLGRILSKTEINWKELESFASEKVSISQLNINGRKLLLKLEKEEVQIGKVLQESDVDEIIEKIKKWLEQNIKRP